jgi:hypothetical protein
VSVFVYVYVCRFLLNCKILFELKCMLPSTYLHIYIISTYLHHIYISTYHLERAPPFIRKESPFVLPVRSPFVLPVRCCPLGLRSEPTLSSQALVLRSHCSAVVSSQLDVGTPLSSTAAYSASPLRSKAPDSPRPLSKAACCVASEGAMICFDGSPIDEDDDGPEVRRGTNHTTTLLFSCII